MNLPRHEQSIMEKMTRGGIDPDSIERFLRMVRRLTCEHSGYVPVSSVSVPRSDMLLNVRQNSHEFKELERRGVSLLPRAVVIKLNGGRSTTMGGEVPKGVLIAKDGRSYLDIITGQVEAIRKKWVVDVPLVLMNSFFTHEPTLEIIKDSPVPIRTFLQSQVPRLVESTLGPLDLGTDEDWCPPGHGDVYESLRRCGLLEELLAEGRRWAFISNLDNLAAGLDPWILGLIERERTEFLIEVTDRTEEDRKGGTLVVREGRVDLLEIAQVPPRDQELFQDIDRFPVFNTNNVWVDLRALRHALEHGGLDLPIIQNRKEVAGTRVLQLETAMGAAVGSFARARGLRVGRERFFPTKKVEDLFVLQSDACMLDSMDRLQSNPLRPPTLPLRPRVVFGTDFLDSPLKMGTRFEDPSTVSLMRAASFEVHGPAFFERDVTIAGHVQVRVSSEKPTRIPRGSLLSDVIYPAQSE